MAEQEVFSLAIKNGNPDPTKWPQLTSSTDNQLNLEGSLKLQPGVAITKFSNDVALAGNSDLALPTERAVKTYVDTQLGSVNTALATKALLTGAANQDFTTKNLTVQGNGNFVGSLQVGSPMKVAGTITADKFIGDGSGLTGLVGITQWVNGAGGAISYSGGNVGINTTAPTRAKLEVAGMIGNTVGLFGADAQGIALVANWAALGINAYYNNGWKSISAGWTANIHVNQDAGGITFQIGQRSTTANAPMTVANHFHVGANGAVSIPGQLNFGASVRQMINLWNEEYGIGVQSGTTYFRSWANYCWFKGGSHNDARDNPGGGVRLMALNEAGDLILSARTNPSGNPAGSLCRALVDIGNKLIINLANDYSQGVEIIGGRFGSSRELKQNIVELSTEQATEALNNLNPVRFSYKTDTEATRHTGFIAEDVPDLLASLDRKSIGPLDVVAVLTKVMQAQQTAIAELAEKVRVLETERS